MPHGHLSKLYLLSSSLVGFVFAFVAEITTVVFLHLLASAPSLGRHSRSNGIDPTTGQHATILIAIFESQAELFRSLKVFGGDRSRNRRGVCAFDVAGVRSPAGSFERRRVDKAIVDGKESLSDTICNFIEIARAKLIRDQPGAVRQLCGQEQRWGAGETHSSSCINDMLAV
jgi:hypothetical protein